MGPERVVLSAPSFDDRLRLTEGGEDASIKDFVPEIPDDLLNTAALALQPDLP